MKSRNMMQLAALALVLVGVFVVKGNAERWCPFGGIEALYTFYKEGNMPCSLGVSNFYILGAVLGLTILYRKVFCSFLCPVGTISEWTGKLGAKLGIKPLSVNYRVDRVLGLLKFVVLAVILFYTYRAGELLFRGYDPCYAILSRHGEDITTMTYASLGLVLVGSLFITVPFCRWLCPLAAVLAPLSRLGVARIKRNSHTCVDCGKCASACPMNLPVDREVQVTSHQCTSCGDCLDACPVKNRAALEWGGPGEFSQHWSRRGLMVAILAFVVTAVIVANAFPIASFRYETGDVPAEVAILDLEVSDLSCRGRCSLFRFFLERQDEFMISGYLKIEAWPGPGMAQARIGYDPTQTDETTIRQAITEAYYEFESDRWWASPFEIVDHEPTNP
jgi:polyferredoxin